MTAMTNQAHLKESMTKKANDLVHDEMAIVRAPGDEGGWIVRSSSGKRPHYVSASKLSFACDEHCLAYKSMKVCSHTLAITMKTNSVNELVKSFRSRKCKPNFTALAEAGKPSTTGKKPKQKGMSKKGGAHIKNVITDAEKMGSVWKYREFDQLHNNSESNSDSDWESSHLLSNQVPARSSESSQMQPSVASSTGTFVVSQSDVQSINFGSVYCATQTPPPLVPAGILSPVLHCAPTTPSSFTSFQHQRPCVDTPFWLAFIFGNVSRCNGCKGKIARDVNNKALPPPDDIVFGHKEYVIFHNVCSGMYEQSREKRNVYYHTWKTCIAPHFSDFNPSKHVLISDSVKEKLVPAHQALIAQEFGLMI